MAERVSDYVSGNSRASVAAQVLGDLLTASSIAALVEVRVETASSPLPVGLPDDVRASSASSHSSESDSYVVAIVCAILAGLIVVAGLLVLLLWRLRKRPQDSIHGHPAHLHAHQPDRMLVEKSNNLQNEENLRLQQQRRSLVMMKTLNVAELPVLSSESSKSKLLDVPATPSPPPPPQSDCFISSCSSNSIESSPIYKAPTAMDLRNNIHLAAKAGHLIEK